MEYIKPIYKIKNVDIKELLNKFDFHRYSKDGFIHRFSIYKYNGKTLIFGEFVIYDEDMNILHINAVDSKYGNFYSYNEEEYGKSKVIEIINNNIMKEIERYTKEGLILKD